jgi:hypothetical protein
VYERPPKNFRYRWEDKFGMDVREILVGRKDMAWVHVAEDRDKWQAVLDAALNLWVP